VAALLLCEALWLGLLASMLGLALGQGFAAALGWFLKLDTTLLVGGMVWPPELAVVPALALGGFSGCCAAAGLGRLPRQCVGTFANPLTAVRRRWIFYENMCFWSLFLMHS
jgi:hypothetical protein